MRCSLFGSSDVASSASTVNFGSWLPVIQRIGQVILGSSDRRSPLVTERPMKKAFRNNLLVSNIQLGGILQGMMKGRLAYPLIEERGPIPP